MSGAGGYESYDFVAEFYDAVPGYRDRPDVRFYVEEAVAAKGPVLEVACGTGRLLIPLASRGVPITGIDLSLHMLKVCRERLAQESPETRACAKIQQADMRDFDLHAVYDLVTLPFRPFQHLETVEEQISCLAAAHRHLSARGRLILDLFNPSLPAIAADNVGREIGPEPEFTMPDGRKVVRWHRFVAKDFFNQINHVEMIYYVTHPDGRRERLVHAFPMRYLFRFEAEHLLARCGFRLLQVYADFERHPYGSSYPGDLILVAEKTRDP
jgi:SAM-dependent methyltransferase